MTFPVEPNKPYDVRGLIDSRDSREFHGICDANSFDEIMNDWAKTIIGKEFFFISFQFMKFTIFCLKTSERPIF